MSNTSNISPYDFYDDEELAESTGNFRPLASSPPAAEKNKRKSLTAWLRESLQPSEEQLARIRAIEQKYQQQYDSLEAVPVKNLEHLPAVTTVNLHLNDLPQLLDSASQMGYAALQTPDLCANGRTLLQHTNGTRIAVSQNMHGSLRLHALGDEQPLRSLVGLHTQNQVLRFLDEKGLQFKSVRLSTGELQILAQEKNQGQSGGSAHIKAQVQADGATWIDIDRCKGNRCETIVQQVAAAVGGKVTGMKKKDSWFELPGEPAQTTETTRTRKKNETQVKLS